jgi:hypothetical protein
MLAPGSSVIVIENRICSAGPTIEMVYFDVTSEYEIGSPQCVEVDMEPYLTLDCEIEFNRRAASRTLLALRPPPLVDLSVNLYSGCSALNPVELRAADGSGEVDIQY